MKRRFFYWVKKYITNDNIRMLLLVIPLFLILVQQLAEERFDLAQFFDVSILITFLLLAVSDGLVRIIQAKVAQNTEDAAKLTTDYGKLIKQYDKGNKLCIQAFDITYPAILLWMRKGTEKIDVSDRMDKYYQLPAQVAKNAAKIMEAHSASSLYNSICIRLDDLAVNPQTNDILLHTSRTHYYDSLLTNRACDFEFGEKYISVRQLYEPGPFLKPFSLSKMSNHLGFNGFVITKDGKVPFLLRKKSLSIAKNQWGPSVAAMLKAQYALSPENQYKMTDCSLSDGIIGEIKDELCITADPALVPEKVQNGIFAFYRDLVEGGKPQFLFCIKLEKTTSKELEASFRECSNTSDTITDGNQICFFTIDQLYNATYHIDNFRIARKTYKMIPSHLVSVILLLEYLKK